MRWTMREEGSTMRSFLHRHSRPGCLLRASTEAGREIYTPTDTTSKSTAAAGTSEPGVTQTTQHTRSSLCPADLVSRRKRRMKTKMKTRMTLVPVVRLELMFAQLGGAPEEPHDPGQRDTHHPSSECEHHGPFLRRLDGDNNIKVTVNEHCRNN